MPENNALEAMEAFCKRCDDYEYDFVCPDGWALQVEDVCDWIFGLPDDALILFKEMVSKIEYDEEKVKKWQS